jgi:hypothetical protein
MLRRVQLVFMYSFNDNNGGNGGQYENWTAVRSNFFRE